MSIVGDAALALKAALDAVDGIEVTTDPSVSVDPPAAVVGPPALAWEAMCSQPTTATFPVYLVVPFDEDAMTRLWDLIEPVSEALDGVRDASVIRADPGVFNAGGQDLPALEIQIEVSL